MATYELILSIKFMSRILPSYKVPLIRNSQKSVTGILNKATKEDIASLTSSEWSFPWEVIYRGTNFEYDDIFKLSDSEKILGLVRFGCFPSQSSFEYLEIKFIEAISKEKRQGYIVGLWLIWYSIVIALEFDNNSSNSKPRYYLIYLKSLPEAIDYYQKKVKMQRLKSMTEDISDVFIFTKKQAEAFKSHIEEDIGSPISFES